MTSCDPELGLLVPPLGGQSSVGGTALATLPGARGGPPLNTSWRRGYFAGGPAVSILFASAFP